jgi:hypothetical protein
LKWQHELKQLSQSAFLMIVKVLQFCRNCELFGESGWENGCVLHLRPMSGPQSDASRVKEFW